MSNSRPPGPMCIDSQNGFIDEGTTALTKMPSGGPISLESSSSDIDQLTESLYLLEVQAAQFAIRFINDSNVRLNYLKEIKTYSETVFAAVQRGEISIHDGHLMTHNMRNTILDGSRLKSSEIGRAYAEGLKAEGWTLKKLYAKYAEKLYKKSFESLSDVERNAVKLEIIKRAGKDRSGPTRAAGRLGQLGKGLWVLTIGIAVYNITTAEDKVEATAREGATLGGGILGGAAAGAATGLVCGPGAVVCSSVLVIVGGGLGALGMDYLFDWVWE